MADADLGDLTRHGRNCRALVGDGFDGPSEGDCNCGLRWRVALATERELHNAWRKRAEEAEAGRPVTHEMVLKAEVAWLDRDEWLRAKANEDNRAWYRANIRAALEAVISTPH